MWLSRGTEWVDRNWREPESMRVRRICIAAARRYAVLLAPFLVAMILLWCVAYMLADTFPSWRYLFVSNEYDAARCTRDVARVNVFPVEEPYVYYYPKSSLQYLQQPAKPHCSKDIQLLIAIKSAHENWRQRYVLRQTWASFNACSDAAYVVSGFSCKQLWKQTRVIFFVGEMQIYESQADLNVRFEAETYGDLVQSSFIDAFHNLTLKAVRMYEWVSTHCPMVQYVLHTDDDVFVNLGNMWTLLSELQSGRMSQVAIYGHLMPGPSFIRERNSKWYVPESVAGESVKPPNYIFAWYMLMSYETMMKIFNAAKCLPMLCIDDLFLSGFVASGIGVPVMDNKCVDWKDISAIPNANTGLQFASLIATHFGDSNTDRLQEAWRLLVTFGQNLTDLQPLRSSMSQCFKH